MELVINIGFIAVTVIYFGLLLSEFKKGISGTSWEDHRKRSYWIRLITVLVSWTVFVAVWSGFGLMSDFSKFPFNFLPVVAPPLIIALIFSFAKSTGEVLQHIPPQNIIRLQSFRVFVELLLWALLIAAIIPVQMTFEGKNFDILAGLSAPIIALLVSRGRISRTGLIIWNVVCLGLLINIVSIAILSTPSPVRIFMNEPSNTVVAYFPVSLLPGLLVPLAYTLHFLSLHQASMKTPARVGSFEKV